MEERKGQREEMEREGEEREDDAKAGGGWGWGLSAMSYLSDLHNQISRSAVVVAQSIADIDIQDDHLQHSPTVDVDDDVGDGDDHKMKSALDNLQLASQDTLLGQGLKVFDSSVDTFASGAWKALGTALQGGSDLILKLEHSAANIAESVQHGAITGSIAPSLLETGKAFTYKGIHALENVGKETMELLISETGIDIGKKSDGADHQADDDQQYEEMTFDRCFYIYGGPEQLEELEALASHYTLIFNRRKAKLSSDQKSFYDGMVDKVQQILDLNTETDDTCTMSDKGKKIEMEGEGSDNEMNSLHKSSVGKAADMAAGFTNAVAGLAADDIAQRTAGRLESLHSEGVHRLSEICCFAVSQLFLLGKSIIATASKSQGDKGKEDVVKIEWPEDSLEKAKIIKLKALSMSGSLEAVSNSFITGISEVTEAYHAGIKGFTTADTVESPVEKSMQEKATAYSEHLRAAQITAIGKIQDGLQYLCFVVLSNSMLSA